MTEKTPSLLVLVPVKDIGDIVMPCLGSLARQTDQDFTLMIHEMKPIHINDQPFMDKLENIVRNRNFMSKMALGSDYEWIMWVDSDVILPPNAIADLKAVIARDPRKYKLIGGWYKKLIGEDWVAGRWVKPNVMRYFTEPMPGIVETDFIGLGCSIMHRSLLEKILFNASVDQFLYDEKGNEYFLGDCITFCRDAQRLGVRPYITGSIICSHMMSKTNDYLLRPGQQSNG